MNSLPLDDKGRLLVNVPAKRTRDKKPKAPLSLPPLLDDELSIEQRLSLLAEWAESERDRVLANTRGIEERSRVRKAYDGMRYTCYDTLSQIAED